MLMRRIAEADNFVVRTSDLNESHSGTMTSLAQLISPQQRQRFVKQVFGGDPAAYDQLMLELDSASDWPQAHRLIRRHFRKHQINPYLKEAASLSNLIYRRYYPHDVYV